MPEIRVVIVLVHVRGLVYCVVSRGPRGFGHGMSAKAPGCFRTRPACRRDHVHASTDQITLDASHTDF